MQTRIAVTSSPNTTQVVNFDVLQEHLLQPILGTLLQASMTIQTPNGAQELLILGQATSLETRNQFHEDPVFKGVIKIQGEIPYLTKDGNLSVGALNIIGAYVKGEDGGYVKTHLSVPPGAGLSLRPVDAGLIHELMAGDPAFGFLGSFYGTKDVPAPVNLRHFGDYDDGGYGEAYMGGVFGPSGSGKSVLAATLLGLWSHQKRLGMLILDPQEEFSHNKFATGSQFQFNFFQLLKTMSGRFDPLAQIIRIADIQLEGTDIFMQILHEKNFFSDGLGVSNAKMEDALRNVEVYLRSLDGWQPWKSWTQCDLSGDFSLGLIKAVVQTYAVTNRDTQQEAYQNNMDKNQKRIAEIWDSATEFFKDAMPVTGVKKKQLRAIMDDVLSHGAIYILNLQTDLGTSFKTYLVDLVVRKLREVCSANFRMDKNPTNALVVLDEAGRFIPAQTRDDDKLAVLSKRIVDSVREMRKMRCGFLFITQTINEIQKDIFRNLHFRIYGVGLGVGSDAEHMIAREGKNAFEVYQTLPDPRLSRIFSYMVAGTLLTLGSSGLPLVIEGYSGGDQILKENGHLSTPTKNNASNTQSSPDPAPGASS